MLWTTAGATFETKDKTAKVMTALIKKLKNVDGITI